MHGLGHRLMEIWFNPYRLDDFMWVCCCAHTSNLARYSPVLFLTGKTLEGPVLELCSRNQNPKEARANVIWGKKGENPFQRASYWAACLALPLLCHSSYSSLKSLTLTTADKQHSWTFHRWDRWKQVLPSFNLNATEPMSASTSQLLPFISPGR